MSYYDMPDTPDADFCQSVDIFRNDKKVASGDFLNDSKHIDLDVDNWTPREADKVVASLYLNGEVFNRQTYFLTNADALSLEQLSGKDRATEAYGIAHGKTEADVIRDDEVAFDAAHEYDPDKVL